MQFIENSPFLLPKLDNYLYVNKFSSKSNLWSCKKKFLCSKCSNAYSGLSISFNPLISETLWK